MDHIIVDIEIQKTIEETPGGWNSTHLLGVSCAVVYEFGADKYRVYGPDDVMKLRDRLLMADRIGGWNTWKFDYPVIWGLPGRERVRELLSKTDDMLRRVWQSLGLDPEGFSPKHGGWSLDIVAQATIGAAKSGFGGDAPKWFQAGNWARLVDYCIQDVKLTRDLTVYADKFGHLVGKNGKRADNRPANLELWVKKQPCGQRPEDLVAHAREIIATYGAEVEA